MFNSIFYNYTAFLMVFIRIMGFVLFNPVFGRRNIPAILKLGFCFILAVIITGLLPVSDYGINNIYIFFFAALKEFFLGYIVAIAMQMFISSFLMAGEISDMQLGLSMSKIYDPQSNISAPLSGSLYQIIFLLLFFLLDGHITLIKIITLSFQVVPVGFAGFGSDVFARVVELFSDILVLAFKIALPVIAVEVILEIGMGILMRSVSTINVFSVGLQIKLLAGFVVMLCTLPAIAALFNSLINKMFETTETLIKLIH